MVSDIADSFRGHGIHDPLIIEIFGEIARKPTFDREISVYGATSGQH